MNDRAICAGLTHLLWKMSTILISKVRREKKVEHMVKIFSVSIYHWGCVTLAIDGPIG